MQNDACDVRGEEKKEADSLPQAAVSMLLSSEYIKIRNWFTLMQWITFCKKKKKKPRDLPYPDLTTRWRCCCDCIILFEGKSLCFLHFVLPEPVYVQGCCYGSNAQGEMSYRDSYNTLLTLQVINSIINHIPAHTETSKMIKTVYFVKHILTYF